MSLRDFPQHLDWGEKMKTLEQIRLEIAGLWEEIIEIPEVKENVHKEQIEILKDHLRNNQISWGSFAHQIKMKSKELGVSKDKFVRLAAKSLSKSEKDFEKFIKGYRILLQPLKERKVS